ncbi:MAG: cation-transporting P-type ATPase [Clostridia bacterium]|nr:cation-transporting P-type ATPase [Clostridia bacterium]
MNEKWFRLSIADIEKKLKTNAASGLSRKAARSRGNRGAGHLFYLPRRSGWRLLLDILSDFSLVILLLGAVFSLFFEIEEYLRGITVLCIAVCALIFCGIVYYRSQRTMESLTSFSYPFAKVVRGGKLFAVDYRSVVIGDIILLEKGDIVCVDARLVTSDGLKVKMRTSANEYVMLEKNAGTPIDPKEQRAREMTNMIHGGSIVTAGSARAIVTAVGKYTYLGAMTGGIPLPVSNAQPKLLTKLRKHCSKINMISLIAILPFTLISLLLGNMLSERQSLLSVAFLTGLALAATTMSQSMCVLLKMYYTHKIRRLVVGEHPTVVKSVEAFDKLSSADYIFMLDGCAVTDGVLHFNSAVCSEGEIRQYNALNKTAKIFSEYVSLYLTAATQMPTTGVSGAGECILGIRSFTDKCNVDNEALKIRCSLKSYMVGNMLDTPERLLFADMGGTYCLSVWRSPYAIQDCKNILLSGNMQPLSAEGIKSFQQMWRKREASGETPILFTLSTAQSNYNDTCILGIVVLKEGVDPDLKNNLLSLERLGCKVISFVKRGNAPKIPSDITSRGCVVKAAFERNKLPITYNFGSISAYSDLSDKDILELITCAHSQNKKVLVIGFTENAAKIASKADGFITCSDINPKTFGYLNEELQTSEIAGECGSTSCIQTVKEKADCLITRSKNGRGGLLSLISALTDIRTVYRNISDYLRYVISTQIIRLTVVGIPMFFGDAILDARHVMLCAFVLDMFVFFALMLRKNVYANRRMKNYCSAKGLKDYFVGDNAITLSSLIASLTAILLPSLSDIIFGGYDYKLEVLFTSLLLLHIVSFILVYYGNNLKELLNVYKNQLLLIEIAVTLVVWILCFTVAPFGMLFGVEGWMSALYFAVSLVSPVVFTVIFIFINRKKQMKKF